MVSIVKFNECFVWYRNNKQWYVFGWFNIFTNQWVNRSVGIFCIPLLSTLIILVQKKKKKNADYNY